MSWSFRFHRGGYALDVLPELAHGWQPGLLVIDGPAHGDRFSDAALALYTTMLSREAVCAVDDTDRSENDRGAAELARACGLVKRDYGDPIYVHHRYSILTPAVAISSVGGVETAEDKPD